MSTDKIILLACMTAFSLILPIGLVIWWKKKNSLRLWDFIAGALCFTVFAMVLEQIPHYLCLMSDNAVSRAILASPVLYTLYASFAAGIFEETGRLFGFKVLLRKQNRKESAVAYGIGHGGIEVILILGVTYLTMLMAAAFKVDMGSAEVNESIVKTVSAFTAGSAFTAAFERISAMMIHVGLSMIVFVAARVKGKLWLYPVAICLHALVDAAAALYQYGALSSIAVVEIYVFALGAICLALGIKLLRSYRDNENEASAA